MTALTSFVARARIDSRSMLWLTAAATVFSAQLVFGYPVVDKVVVYAMLGLILLGVWPREKHPVLLARGSTRFEIHRLGFVAFAVYGVFEALRGAIVLADLRVVFYMAMFAAVAVLGWLGTGEPVDRERAARTVAVSSGVYFILYIVVGVIAEWIFGVNRTDLQGWLWSGTTVAVFPAYLAFPAMAVLPTNQRRDRWLFWLTLILVVVTAFYYQSRSLWVSMILLAPFCMGFRRIAAFASILTAFFLIFPWGDPKPLTPMRLWDDVSQDVATLVRQPVQFLGNKAEGVRLVLIGDPAGLFREAVSTKPAGPSASMAEPPDTPPPPEPSLAPGVGTADPGVPPVHDVDRVIALQAAWCTAMQDGIAQLLFGSGYWTSRYEMVPCVQRLAQLHNYEFPAVYGTIVRTATFNGMLVDMGLLGVVMLGLLFGATALAVIMSRSGPILASLTSLGLIALSLFTSQNYGLLLLYFVLMPGGPLLLLHGAQASNVILADAVAKRDDVADNSPDRVDSDSAAGGQGESFS